MEVLRTPFADANAFDRLPVLPDSAAVRCHVKVRLNRFQSSYQHLHVTMGMNLDIT